FRECKKMYYTLSKLLPALIMPLSLLFFALGLFVILRNTKHRKIAKINLILWFIVVYFFSLSPIANYFVLESEKEWKNFKPDSQTKFPTVVVLGGLMTDGNHHDYEFTTAVDRLLTAIRYVRLGRGDYLLLSGGKAPFSDATPEADLMKLFINEF